MTIGVISFAHPHAISYATNLASRGDVTVITTDPGPYPEGEVRGAALAEGIGVAYVDSLEELFRVGVDGVIVASENSRHRELVEAAAAAGVSVLCEKPLATSLEDAAAMIEAVKRAGRTLMVAYPVRFAPEFAELKRLVSEGALGSILGISGTNNGKIPLAERAWFTDPDLAGGGALVDHIVHCADLIDELLEGEPAEEVNAIANGVLHRMHGVEVETGGLVSLRYPSGVIATIDCSWSQPETADTWGGLTLEVQGTRGSMRVAPFASHVGGFGHGGSLYCAYGPDLDGLLLDRFLEALRDGSVPEPSGMVGYRTLAVVDAAQRSAQAAAPVGVSAPPL